MGKTVRTRFAPSPTGRMHVGNLRTALYAYLIAKHEGGQFLLRIEDTDQEREMEGAVDIIYRTLASTGLIHDEGPDGNASEENSPEEISEDEALPESEEPAQSVEDTVSASEKDTAVAKNPSFSEDDEWLYSKPRRFAKKPANPQED